MTPDWRPITDPSDADYSASPLHYWAPWAGNDQVAEFIGPDGHNDPGTFGTVTVDTDAVGPTSGLRYVWAPL